MKSEQQLKDKVKQVEKLTGNVTGKLETIDDTVQKNYVAFEVGLRHAATQAVDAKQKGIYRILVFQVTYFMKMRLLTRNLVKDLVLPNYLKL